LKAASVGRIYEATLTTRKPPKTFSGSLYIKEKEVDINRLREPENIYEGSAEEVCKLFPENVNIAPTLSLASVGPEKQK
jgi:aspartate dehydrogenase